MKFKGFLKFNGCAEIIVGEVMVKSQYRTHSSRHGVQYHTAHPSEAGALLAGQICNSGRRKKPNRTETDRLILQSARIGRRNEPNRAGPSHDASKKPRPNRVEPGNMNFRTEPDRRFVESLEPNRTEPVPSWTCNHTGPCT